MSFSFIQFMYLFIFVDVYLSEAPSYTPSLVDFNGSNNNIVFLGIRSHLMKGRQFSSKYLHPEMKIVE